MLKIFPITQFNSSVMCVKPRVVEERILPKITQCDPMKTRTQSQPRPPTPSCPSCSFLLPTWPPISRLCIPS